MRGIPHLLPYLQAIPFRFLGVGFFLGGLDGARSKFPQRAAREPLSGSISGFSCLALVSPCSPELFPLPLIYTRAALQKGDLLAVLLREGGLGGARSFNVSIASIPAGRGDIDDEVSACCTAVTINDNFTLF